MFLLLYISYLTNTCPQLVHKYLPFFYGYFHYIVVKEYFGAL